MFESGYLTLAKVRGTPLRAHWSIALGAVLFGGLRFAPLFWLSFFGLVLIHELGHAALVWRYRHQVLSIDVTGFGGLCRWAGHATPFQRAAIAWGGVLAQAVVLVVAFAASLLFGPMRGPLAEPFSVLITTNLVLIGLNLLPIPPLDGAEAWPILKHLRSWRGGSGRGSGRSGPPRVTSRRDDALHPDMADFLKRVAEEAKRARRD